MASTRCHEHQAPPNHRATEKDERDNDEGNGRSLIREDSQDHPDRDGEERHDEPVSRRQTRVASGDQSQPPKEKADRKRPGRRGESGEPVAVIVNGAANAHEEQYDPEVSKGPGSLHGGRA